MYFSSETHQLLGLTWREVHGSYFSTPWPKGTLLYLESHFPYPILEPMLQVSHLAVIALLALLVKEGKQNAENSQLVLYFQL